MINNVSKETFGTVRNLGSPPKERIMNTRTRLTSFFMLALLPLMVSACKPKIVIGREEF